MRLLTTTIGAYPKPEYIELPDWFGAAAGPDTEAPTENWAGALARMGDDAEEILVLFVGAYLIPMDKAPAPRTMNTVRALWLGQKTRTIPITTLTTG